MAITAELYKTETASTMGIVDYKDECPLSEIISDLAQWHDWDYCIITRGEFMYIVSIGEDQAALLADNIYELAEVIAYDAEKQFCHPIDTNEELHGTDCPAWKCSVCNELFEEGVSYCSQCGAKVVK